MCGGGAGVGWGGWRGCGGVDCIMPNNKYHHVRSFPHLSDFSSVSIVAAKWDRMTHQQNSSTFSSSVSLSENEELQNLLLFDPHVSLDFLPRSVLVRWLFLFFFFFLSLFGFELWILHKNVQGNLDMLVSVLMVLLFLFLSKRCRSSLFTRT